MTGSTLITPTARPPEPRRDHVAAIVGGIFAALLGGYIAGKAAWAINPWMSQQLLSPGWHAAALFKAIGDLSGLGWDGWASKYTYATVTAGWPAWWRLGSMWGTALATGTGSFALLNRKTDPIRHIRGRQLRKGAEALEEVQRAAAMETGRNEPGIELILGSSIRISQDRETKHFIVIGGTGSGKTVAVSHIITQAQARGDRMLIVDYKGLTEKAPGKIVIADPTDSRGMLWDIAADIRTRWDAEECATRMIPDSGKDPFWSNGSRAILAGLMTYCINTKPGKWGFSDLAELMRHPIESYMGIMAGHYPQALAFVANFESNTTDSLIKNMSVTAKFIFQLAAAEQAAGERQRISFRDWIENPSHPARTIILKINDAFAGLSASYNQAIIGVICSRVSALPDIPPTQNRVWIIADEFPRLGKVIGWDQFLAVGRSKGLRIVTVAQSVSQLRQVFGEHETDTWTSIVGSLVLGRNDGATAKWYCDIIGDREVWTPGQSIAASFGGFTTSSSYQRERLPVLIPSQCATDLGVRQGGCDSLLYGFQNVHILRWRFLSAADGWATQRIDYKPAVWTLPANLSTETTPEPARSKDATESERAPATMQSELSWTTIERPDIDVYSMPIEVKEQREAEGEQVVGMGAEQIIDHAAEAIAGGAVHGIGGVIELVNELGGQEQAGEVETAIQPKTPTRSRFVSRKKARELEHE